MQTGPVFILGLHRSGTTLLYQLLGATGFFNIVTARHVAFFDDLVRPHRDRLELERRVVERFAALGQTDRRVDAVPVGPDAPEEYGFLLERLTGSRRFLRSSLASFSLICDTIGRDAGTVRPALLKNPWDFDRIDVIQELVPEARFVFIHRNPFHVLSSTLRMALLAAERPDGYMLMLSESYRTLCESEFLWRVVRRLGSDAPGLLADGIIRDVARRARGFMRCTVRGDLHRFPQIRYEALCEDPNGVIRTALDRLGFPTSDRNLVSRIGRSHSSVHALIAERRGRIVDLFGSYASTFGYDLDQIADGLAGDLPKHE
jgi:hypothetical protein